MHLSCSRQCAHARRCQISHSQQVYRTRSYDEDRVRGNVTVFENRWRYARLVDSRARASRVRITKTRKTENRGRNNAYDTQHDGNGIFRGERVAGNVVRVHTAIVRWTRISLRIQHAFVCACVCTTSVVVPVAVLSSLLCR